jgi:hypothetical protein
MLRSPHSRAHVTVASSARSRPSIGPPSQHDPRRCCQVHRHRQHLCRIPPPPILVVAGNETTDDTMRFVRHNAPRPPRGATDGAYALGSALSTRRIDTGAATAVFVFVVVLVDASPARPTPRVPSRFPYIVDPTIYSHALTRGWRG